MNSTRILDALLKVLKDKETGAFHVGRFRSADPSEIVLAFALEYSRVRLSRHHQHYYDYFILELATIIIISLNVLR